MLGIGGVLLLDSKVKSILLFLPPATTVALTSAHHSFKMLDVKIFLLPTGTSYL
jgi:hypothetical protein